MHILHSDRDVADYTVSEANVNLLLLCFKSTSRYNNDWSVADIFQGEIKYKESPLHSDIRDVEFITFGIVLIVWEVLPTFMFVWFFRVRRPNVGDMVSKVIIAKWINGEDLLS